MLVKTVQSLCVGVGIGLAMGLAGGALTACGQAEGPNAETKAEALLWSPDENCEPEWTWFEGDGAVYPGSLGVINTNDELRVLALIPEEQGWSLLRSTVYLSRLSSDGEAENEVELSHDYSETPLNGEDLFIFPLAKLELGCGDTVAVSSVIDVVRETDSGPEYATVWAVGNDLVGYDPGTFGYEICCADKDPGCTLTQGYWKNHENDWPAEELELGGELYSAEELMDALNTQPRRGNATVILAHQMIAARLNGANGAAVPEAVEQGFFLADAWLADHETGLTGYVAARTSAGQKAIALAELFAQFNEGATGPGHCDR